jgi:hypothetical protein
VGKPEVGGALFLSGMLRRTLSEKAIADGREEQP